MYDHILVPVDLEHSDTSVKALRTAQQIAKDYSAVLHLLNVVPPIDAFASGFFREGYAHQMTEAALEKLHRFSTEMEIEGLTIQHIVAHGAIYDQILRMADKVNADLIVMASHRPELSDYLLGPNAAKVVRHASCSVMVVRNKS